MVVVRSNENLLSVGSFSSLTEWGVGGDTYVPSLCQSRNLGLARESAMSKIVSQRVFRGGGGQL